MPEFYGRERPIRTNDERDEFLDRVRPPGPGLVDRGAAESPETDDRFVGRERGAYLGEGGSRPERRRFVARGEGLNQPPLRAIPGLHGLDQVPGLLLGREADDLRTRVADVLELLGQLARRRGVRESRGEEFNAAYALDELERTCRELLADREDTGAQREAEHVGQGTARILRVALELAWRGRECGGS